VTELLSIRGLQVAYRTRHGSIPATFRVDLDVSRGQVVALVGESGSGKSTTAHAVIGLLPRGGRVESGQILFEGRDLLTVTERELRDVRGGGIGLIPQDPTVSLNPLTRVGAQVAEVLEIHGLVPDTRAAAEQAVELLRRAGLPDPEVRARQYPHQLSGGMCQRVLIAIALAGRPRLVIADEPTSALDVTVQRQVLDHLETLTRESDTAVLLITHDLGIAADRAQHVVVMSQGRVVEQGPTERVLSEPSHPYTRRLIADAPSLASTRLRTRPPPPAPNAKGSALVEVADLVKDFSLPSGGASNTLRAVDRVSFSIRRGETFALVGESGSGKSTTARLLLRLSTPTSGRVVVDGRDITASKGADLRAVRRRVQLVYQNPYASLDPRFTIEEIVAEPLRAFRIGSRAQRRTRVAELIDQVALPVGALSRRPTELSGGQRQRVAIARALAVRPDLLVCDEPVSALDVTVQTQILRLLSSLQDELGLTMLFITHDLAVVRQIADRVGVMRDGALVETGPADQIFGQPRHEYTKQLLTAIPGARTLNDGIPLEAIS
jgi:peptide/nickel transport system ATP-binding protein